MISFTLSKKRILVIVLLLAIILASLDVARIFLLNGKLVVIADPDAKISILSANKKIQEIGVGQASVRLGPGKYLIQTGKGDSVSRATASVRSRNTTKIQINSTPIYNSEKIVENQSARFIKADQDNSFTYLNVPYHQMFKYTLGAQKPDVYKEDIYPINRIDWLDGNNAVISLASNISSYYLNSVGQTTSLDFNLNSQTTSYAISPKGEIMYIANNQVLKKASLFTPISELIMDLSSGAFSISVSPDSRFVFAYADINNVDSPNNQARSDFDGYITDTKKPLDTKSFVTNSTIGNALWSSDSKFLIYNQGSNLVVRKMDAGDVSEILTTNQDLPVWLLGTTDADTLIYAQDSTVWKFDIKSGISYKLANYEGVMARNSFAIAPDKKTIYFSTDTDIEGKGGDIYRIVL